MTPKYVLVNVADYNGHHNAWFMFRADDDRLLGDGHTVVAEGRYDRRRATFEADGRAWRVFADWSLREMGGQR